MLDDTATSRRPSDEAASARQLFPLLPRVRFRLSSQPSFEYSSFCWALGGPVVPNRIDGRVRDVEVDDDEVDDVEVEGAPEVGLAPEPQAGLLQNFGQSCSRLVQLSG